MALKDFTVTEVNPKDFSKNMVLVVKVKKGLFPARLFIARQLLNLAKKCIGCDIELKYKDQF